MGKQLFFVPAPVPANKVLSSPCW